MARPCVERNVLVQQTEDVSRSDGSVLTGPDTPSTSIRNDTLVAGEVLSSGRSLAAPAGGYAALLREDGDLVVCRVADSTQTWASHTRNHAGASVVMKDDRELAIHALGGECLWRTPTSGNPGAFVKLHEDGQLAIHGFYGDLLWSSNDLA